MWTCPVLGPRWDRSRQAEYGAVMLPSAHPDGVGSHKCGFSGRNRTACPLAVYASQHGLPHDHARLTSGCRPALPGGIGHPLGPNARFVATVLMVASSLSSLPKFPGATRFPDSLRPTTAVGLSDDSTTDRETSKRFFCSTAGRSGRLRAMMRPKTPRIRPSVTDAGRPSPSPPHPPAVSSCAAVIPAPVPAA